MNLQEMRQRQPIKRRLEAKAEADKTLVYLYGDVVDEKPVDWWTGEEIDKEYILAEDVRNTVDAIESDLVELHINSYGGSLFASVAIFNFLRASGKKIDVVIDGVAASGASLIAMCGRSLKMPKNTMLMIHRASTFGYGNCEDLRKTADMLEKLDNTVLIETYADKCNCSRDELMEKISNETWISAAEAYDLGLCDELIETQEKPPTNKEMQEVSNLLKNFANINF